MDENGSGGINRINWKEISSFYWDLSKGHICTKSRMNSVLTLLEYARFLTGEKANYMNNLFKAMFWQNENLLVYDKLAHGVYFEYNKMAKWLALEAFEELNWLHLVPSTLGSDQSSSAFWTWSWMGHRRLMARRGRVRLRMVKASIRPEEPSLQRSKLQ